MGRDLKLALSQPEFDDRVGRVAIENHEWDTRAFCHAGGGRALCALERRRVSTYLIYCRSI